MGLLLSDLLPGDVIFFRNQYLSDEEEIDWEYVDHVALFLGTDAAGVPLIVHAIKPPSAGLPGIAIGGVCKSPLTTLKNQIQADPEYGKKRYHVQYEVFRSAFPPLQELALKVLVAQIPHRIPYDEKRLEEKFSREARGFEAEDFKRLGERLYRPHGLFRSIKFAARHPGPMTRVSPEGVGRGLTCSMAAILAFQVAELVQSGCIRSANESGVWVSDKHPSLETLREAPEAFHEYYEKIKPHESSDTPHQPSFLFWCSREVRVDEFIHKTFAVDCKTIGAAGMYAYMKEKTNSWMFLGGLELEASILGDELDISDLTELGEEATRECEAL